MKFSGPVGSAGAISMSIWEEHMNAPSANICRTPWMPTKSTSASRDTKHKEKCVRQKRKAEETEKPKAKKAKIEAEVHAADKIKVEKDAQGEEIEKPKEDSAHKGCCSAGKPKAKDKPKAVVKPKVKEAKDTVKIEKEGDVEIIVLD